MQRLQQDNVAQGVGGYVLAGGHSSRMGRDKAMLELAGYPLIAHAVGKVRRLTGEAQILAGEPPGNPALGAFGPLLFDLHPGCGPIGGMESALAHTRHEWNLILPVDVPFFPAVHMGAWLQRFTSGPGPRCPVALFEVEGRPQPTLLLVHREVRPFLTAAIGRGEYRLMDALRTAVRELGTCEGFIGGGVPHVTRPAELLEAGPEAGAETSLWFSNLNTPEEFAAAEVQATTLDPLA